MVWIANPVLGSSCLPVWFTGMGTSLLQKLEEVLLPYTMACLHVHCHKSVRLYRQRWRKVNCRL